MDFSKSAQAALGGDIYVGARAKDVWMMLGWNDIKQRYRRSTIGPWWMTLSTGILVTGLGFIYSQIFKMSIETYLPYLALGFVVWGFISSSTMESCSAFFESEAVIKQLRMPFSVFVLRVIWRNFIVLLHTMIVFVPISIMFGIVPSWTILLALPGLLLVVLNQLWIGIILATLSARFRDVPQMVGAVIQVAIFATPIMWPVSALGDHAFVADINPLHHLIDIVRAPLLGETSTALSWCVAVGLNATGALIAMAVLQRTSKRIVYWL